MSQRIKTLVRGTSNLRYGNRHAAKENYSEDAHNRRLQGMFKTWANCECKRRGEAMPHKDKSGRTERKRERNRLRETEVVDQRQAQDICRKSAVGVMDILKEIVANPAERASDRIAAGNTLLDRAYGKAGQTNTNVNIEAHGKYTELSTAELTTRIEQTIKAIEITTRRTVQEKQGQKQLIDLRKRDGDPGGSSFH